MKRLLFTKALMKGVPGQAQLLMLLIFLTCYTKLNHKRFDEPALFRPVLISQWSSSSSLPLLEYFLTLSIRNFHIHRCYLSSNVSLLIGLAVRFIPPSGRSLLPSLG
jgi:hypothetical protein